MRNISPSAGADGNPTVVFPAPRQVEIVDRPMPSPAAGHLLVRTLRTLISTGTELTILSGDFEPGSAWDAYGRFPFVAGYSHVGEVIGVGDGVEADWVGAIVATGGPHARYVSVPAAAAVRARGAEGLVEPLTLTTLAQTVMNGIRRGGVGWGDAVVVYGLGLLGQLAVRFCRLCGARPVVGVDVIDSRLELVPRDPAVVSVNPRDADVRSAVAEATGGRMADVVIELTGNPELIPAEFASLRERQGRFVMLSSPRGAGTSFNFHDLCNAPSHTIIGAHISSHPPVETPAEPWTMQRNAELFAALLRDRELDLAPLVSDRLDYREAPAAYLRLLEDRSEAMAVVLSWDEA